MLQKIILWSYTRLYLYGEASCNLEKVEVVVHSRRHSTACNSYPSFNAKHRLLYLVQDQCRQLSGDLSLGNC